MPKGIPQQLPALITDTADILTEPRRRAGCIATVHQLIPDLFSFHKPIPTAEFKSRVEAMGEEARHIFTHHAYTAINELRERSQGISNTSLGLLVEVPVVAQGVSIGVLLFAEKNWGRKETGIDQSKSLGVSILERDHRFVLTTISGDKDVLVVSKAMETSCADSWNPKNIPVWSKSATMDQVENLVGLMTFVSDGLTSGELTPVALDASMNPFELGLC